LKKLERVTCQYCAREFHALDKNKDKTGPTLCERCEDDTIMYTEPRQCAICELHAAFDSTQCRRCQKATKQHGPPVQCEQCNKTRAFQKPSADKVGGRTLCYECTIKFKRDKHEKGREEKVEGSSKEKRKDKQSNHQSEKRQKLDVPTSTTSLSSSPSLSASASPARSPNILSDSLTSSGSSDERDNVDWRAKYTESQRQLAELEKDKQSYIDKYLAQRTEIDDLKKQLKDSSQRQSSLQANVSEQLGFRDALEKTWENQKNVIMETNKKVVANLYVKIQTLETELEKRAKIESRIKPVEE